MAIYNEDTDPNILQEISREKENIIEQINDIIESYGTFSIDRVQKDKITLFQIGDIKFLTERFEINYIYLSFYKKDIIIGSTREKYANCLISDLQSLLEITKKWENLNKK